MKIKRNLKKIASLLLAVVMVFAMTATAFADTTGTGTITINGVSKKSTYKIYKLLDLESYDTASGAYSYKVNADWAEFFKTEEALKYVAIDEEEYVTWVANDDDTTVATFAKAALAYAKENDEIAPVKSSDNEGEFVIIEGQNSASGQFSGLTLGYYLVDSTVGALCGLTTTNPAASINAKNKEPKIDKQVHEDSTEQWANTNTADIGQTVSFRVTIDVHDGAENYVLHDNMSSGLTFKGVTKIEHVIPSVSTEDVPTNYYTVEDENTCGEECTFEVKFTQEFCDHLETNDKIVVYYQAKLNKDAVIAGDGNTNEVYLEYGEDNYTTHDTTQTYTYGIDIVKTDSQYNLITGAQFKIYDALTGGNEIAVVLTDDKKAYRRARKGVNGEQDEEGVPIVVEGGRIRVVGFDNGTYYLEETVAPAGYNKLTARTKFIISDANLDATFNGDIYSTGSGVHVVNKTGSMLPETGGIGTTIFYILGGLLVFGAVVLMVTKKRMNSND